MNRLDISEHWDKVAKDDLDCLKKLSEKEYKKTFSNKKNGEQSECFSMVNEEGIWYISSSYYIGTDWLDAKNSSIRISPKVNSEGREINYLLMLEEALKEPKNFGSLDGLVNIDFDKPYIEIPQNEDFLSLFLISEYLHIIEQITKKGLKKSYYYVDENLKSKIKGKLLFNKQVKKNLIIGAKSDNYCRHQEYGENIPENKLLKKALLICRKQLELYGNKNDLLGLNRIILKVMPNWKYIDSDIEINKLGNVTNNRFYSEYPIAINIAKLIIRKTAFVHIEEGIIMTTTPPYWIDMTKLFEMYVYKKLRNRYKDRVKYHIRTYRQQEPDYLLEGDSLASTYIIDAKYKPRYKDSLIDIDDIRQVSGYARMKNIHEKLNIDERSIIPCLIIYPDQDATEELKDESDFDKEKGYIDIFKTGIRLPEIDKQNLQSCQTTSPI